MALIKVKYPEAGSACNFSPSAVSMVAHIIYFG